MDSNVLSKLDELEGHPTWYKRTKCEIITTSTALGSGTGDVLSCSAYFLTDFAEQLLSLEFFSEYTQDCNKLYLKSDDRPYVEVQSRGGK